MLSRLTRSTRLEASLAADGGIERQPPLALDDGTQVSLDAEQWAVSGGARAARLHSASWSVGGSVRAGRDDPKGQFRGWAHARSAVQWDRYPANDPRGNRLALFYFLGYRAEGYHRRNERGEESAHFPEHGVSASGSVRKDRISIGLSLTGTAMLIRPGRRHSLTAEPFIEWKLGDHVDLTLYVRATKRALPGPDPDAIDPSDYALQSRLAYADPFALTASFRVSIHWDRTNGARNDRLEDLR